ncbi:CDP-Glycerol:Poly(glycerophosphate) glycerophosphotransferase superfamily [Aciduliprofundum boonei T469]|nr:CDP-Glycerol:Poly(glycerophosphate) glycerophosphotransferase superfamily [Aciduliprofundum boonei T469]
MGPKGITFTKEDYESHYFCVASEFSKKRHIELWNAPPEKLFVTGFARLDRLLKYLQKPTDELRAMLNIPKDSKKIILYAPTFDIGLWPWEDPYEGIAQLAKFLKKYNSYLLVRTHPYAKYSEKKLERYLKNYNNVKFVPMKKYPDTMLLLAVSDVLITDWSSIYTDYLVTKRPIIFLEINKNYFTQQRGFSEIPPNLRPGYIVLTKDEFYKALKISILKGDIPDIKFYEKCLKLIHGDANGKYSDM